LKNKHTKKKKLRCQTLNLAFNTNKPVLVQRFDTTRKATV